MPFTFRPIACRAVVALASVAVASCGGSSRPVSPVTPSSTTSASAPRVNLAVNIVGMTGLLVGAGDIGVCNGAAGAESTARLLDRFTGTVFAAGDNAYAAGSLEEFKNCYEPSWGRHRGRTRPVPGNHEYQSGGSGYYAYFGGTAGPSGLGYYSYAEGPWRVIALNSEIAVGAGSPQVQWLRGELAGNRSACTAVIWHRPLFSSGRNGDNQDMRDVWRTLYDFDVDLVINGHDHIYERFAPQDPSGLPDAERGIREFIVGTGGAPLTDIQTVHANSEARGAVWGVAVFRLGENGFQWQFVPVEGQTFQDSGSAACH
jgi:acid phosphatase type 7